MNASRSNVPGNCLFATILVLGCLVGPSYARPVLNWADEKLTADADLVVIAAAKSSSDEDADRSNAKPDSWVGVNTVFTPLAVLKGKLEARTFTVLHDRYFDRKMSVEIVDGPGFVEFDLTGSTNYLLFLKKLQDGRFAAVSGRMDPHFSVKILKQYSDPAPPVPSPAMTLTKMDEAKQNDWLTRWDKEISGESRGYRTCDRTMGEDIAWGMTPVMDGYYNGYMATKNAKYVDMMVDWADSLIKRAVKEPDGYVGWPSPKAAGTEVDSLDNYNADSFLSDAMVFTPIVLLAGEMTRNPALKEKYGAKGEAYLELAEQLYEKWVKRGGRRETEDGGMISVALPYGLDKANEKWIDFDTRNDPGHGFSHPDNKANEVARWMLAMWDVTGKRQYKERAEKWFKLQKSRMTLKSDGTYEIWNYWQPAGPWDYKPGGHATKHWVGVHPNGGYYQGDTRGIVAAYEHGLVFTKADIDRLIDTAKVTWTAGDPASPTAGMAISIQPSTGTSKAVNACFPNSKTTEPTSAGPGALSGTAVSVEWNAKAGKGRIVVQPKDPQSAQVTIDTDKGTKVQVLRMWSALAPYDADIQKNFEATENPESWAALAGVPHYLTLQSKLAGK